MSNVLHFPRHKLHCCDAERCFVCEGGLGLCSTCGGAEIELPTDCPGTPLTDAQRQGICDGTMDYIQGYGWVISSGAYPEKKTSSQLYLDRVQSLRCNDAA